MRTEFPPIARLPCLMDSYIAQMQYVIPSSIKRQRPLGSVAAQQKFTTRAAANECILLKNSVLKRATISFAF